ncbi:MAG: amidase, partial [Candidatus Gastranaerophilaceae bacterium]
MKENIFNKLSISKILEKYKTGDLTPVDVIEECIKKTELYEEKYKAWVCFDKELLRKKAVESSKRILNGEKTKDLEGIPIGVKDIYNSIEFPTQMGSPLWKDFTPGNDARTVFYLKQAGAIIAGKTVTAEFAVHTLDKTLNPHDITKTPGTSSSGSAAAIALGMVPVALGTQTAGSIIRPASFCGVYGCKPSFGLLPRTGILKTTDSLDSLGFFVAQCQDLHRIFDIMSVKGPNYPISHKALKDFRRQNKDLNRPWRVAFVKTHTWEDSYDYAKNEILNFISKLSNDKNIEIVEIELPEIMNNTHEMHASIYDKALSYYFKEEFQKAELVSPIMNKLIENGNRINVEKYHNALAYQTEICHVMDNLLEGFDAMISLSTAGEAPPRGEFEKNDPALMWTMTHLPVVNVPAFTSPTGLPFGVQIAARKYNDLLLFRFLNYLKDNKYIPE